MLLSDLAAMPKMAHLTLLRQQVMLELSSMGLIASEPDLSRSPNFSEASSEVAVYKRERELEESKRSLSVIESDIEGVR